MSLSDSPAVSVFPQRLRAFERLGTSSLPGPPLQAAPLPHSAGFPVPTGVWGSMPDVAEDTVVVVWLQVLCASGSFAAGRREAVWREPWGGDLSVCRNTHAPRKSKRGNISHQEDA